MKNEKGFSLIVLVITIVLIIIISTISIRPSTNVIDEATDAKNQSEATLDNNEIESIITYELSGKTYLIDEEIDLMRVELISGDREVHYDGKTYGDGYVLYIGERDLNKIKNKVGSGDLKVFHEISKSYVVNSDDGKKVRLEDEWSF